MGARTPDFPTRYLTRVQPRQSGLSVSWHLTEIDLVRCTCLLLTQSGHSPWPANDA